MEVGFNFTNFSFVYLFLFLVLLTGSVHTEGKDGGKGEGEKWKKKDVRDYTEADMERLYEQWEVTPAFIYIFLLSFSD